MNNEGYDSRLKHMDMVSPSPAFTNRKGMLFDDLVVIGTHLKLHQTPGYCSEHY